MRRLLVFLLFVATMGLAQHAAYGCSCMQGDPRAMLREADGAIVGVFLSRTEATPGPGGLTNSAQDVHYLFRVEKAVKGRFAGVVAVTAASSGASCGLEFWDGRRVGLLLSRSGRSWRSGLCSMLDPGVLTRAARPLPPPESSGPMSFLLGGGFGDARLVGLDRRGRIVAYGKGEGTVGLLSVCPGAMRVAELATVHTGPQLDEARMAVRDLSTFRVLWETRVRNLPGGDPASITAISCRDAAGSNVLAFVGPQRAFYPPALTSSGAGPSPTLTPAGPEGRIEIVRASGEEVAYRGSWQDATIAGSFVYLSGGANGELIERLDLRTGARQRIAKLRLASTDVRVGAPIPSPDGERVAVIAIGEQDGVLTLVDLSTISSRVRDVTLPLAEGPVVWADDQTLVASSYGGGPVRIFDTRLNDVGSFSGWSSYAPLVSGHALIGVGNGRIQVAPLPNGPAMELNRFDSPVTYALATVPDLPAPSATRAPSSPPPSADRPFGVSLVTADRVPAPPNGMPITVATALAAVLVGSRTVLRGRRNRVAKV